MSVDYNLVVIGYTAAGVQAAIMAAQFKARVVLVGQPDAIAPSSVPLTSLAHLTQQVATASQFGLATSIAQPLTKEYWSSIATWAHTIAQSADLSQSAAILSRLGIEVIVGQGEFCRKPSLGFVVNGRVLRSRSYLLTPHFHYPVPAVDGLDATGVLTPADLLQPPTRLEKISELVILGNGAIGVELAQSLNRLGVSVTLISEADRLLPHADPEAAFLIQTQLEAEGVHVLTQTPISQARSIQGKKWLQVGNQAIEADEILLATPPQPTLSHLNLGAIGQPETQPLRVNQRLQTLNPRIYACLGRSGQLGQPETEYQPHRVPYEASVAVKNALFLPTRTVESIAIPLCVHTAPALASVGLTEPQAIAQYGKAVQILRQDLKGLPIAQTHNEMTGMCKLIVRSDGRILGGHIVSPQAGEVISAIALAMQQKLSLRSLQWIVPTSTYAEILQQTIQQQPPCLQPSWLETWLEWWSNTRRS